MAFPILANTPLRCTMGIAPAPITLIPKLVTAMRLEIVRIDDCIPMLNIKPFIMCQNPLNPAVAAVIAASLGTIRQAPCIPLPTPWLLTSFSTFNRGPFLATSNSMKMCYPGGIIKPIPIPSIVNISR